MCNNCDCKVTFRKDGEKIKLAIKKAYSEIIQPIPFSEAVIFNELGGDSQRIWFNDENGRDARKFSVGRLSIDFPKGYNFYIECHSLALREQEITILAEISSPKSERLELHYLGRGFPCNSRRSGECSQGLLCQASGYLPFPE